MSKPSSTAIVDIMDHSMWGPFWKMASTEPGRPTSVEARLTRLEDEQAIKDVHAKYAYFYDAGNVDGVMQVFHDDCVLVNPRGTYIGRKAIRENYEYLVSTRRFSFHHTSNLLVRFSEAGDDAVMTSYLIGTNLLHSGNVASLNGSYVDRLHKFGTRWLFTERRITSNFRYHLPAFPTLNLPPAPPKPTREESTRDWIGPEGLL